MPLEQLLQKRDAIRLVAMSHLDAEKALELANNVAAALADGAEPVPRTIAAAVHHRIAQGWLNLDVAAANALINALCAAWNQSH